MPLNQVEEAKFRELRDKCRELKVPAPPEIMIGLKVHDKDGVLVFDDVQRGHSWTRNFWNRHFAIPTQCYGDGSGLFGAGYMSAKTTGGTVRSLNTCGAGGNLNSALGRSTGYGFFANAGVSASGIVVGTGDTAFGLDQYTLVSQIVEGTGAGNFSHQATTFSAPAYTGGSKTWKETIYRIFNNNSGGSITVKEVGIYNSSGSGNYSNGMFTTTNAEINMLERSVLSPTVAVANGAQLTVTYEISMDFSAID